MRFPDGAVTGTDRCVICAMEDDAAAAFDGVDPVVLADEHWALQVAPGYEVPGWFFLRARRHALGWTDLTHEELSSFGPVLAASMETVARVYDAPARYVFSFGEAYPHLHCIVTSRGDDVGPEHRTAALLGLRAERSDRASALARLPELRAAHAGLRT